MTLAIPRARLLTPGENSAFAVVAIALSLYVFAYSLLYGQASILLFYACWLPLLILRPELLLTRTRPVILILLLPGFAALSTLWSDVTTATLRASIQYGTTVLCGLIAARVVSVRDLTLGGLLGGLLVLLYSHNNGEYGYDFVDASYAFQGAFESKNQLGFYAALTVLFGIATLMLPGAGLILRAAALGIAAFALWTLILSDSATSVIALVAGLFTAAAVLGIMRITVKKRAQSIVLALCIMAGIVAIASQIGAFDAVFVIFGKDPTLTGRTYLWNQGIVFGADRPAVGLGYYSFWVRNRPEAETLWREFYITARTGFHFHNTLIESYVALGLVGVALVAGWTLALLANAMRMLMNTGGGGTAALCAALAIIFVIRSFVEIDFLTPYTAGSFMVPFILLKMSDLRRSVIQSSLRPVQPVASPA